MDAMQNAEKYEKNIKKLAEKNDIDFELMKDNWIAKYEEFDNITNESSFDIDLEQFAPDEIKPFIALTINGSIIIASIPDEDGMRKVRYHSIKIRTDDSINVPEIFNAKIKGDIAISKTIVFEDVMETSFLINIKSSDDIDADSFEDEAEMITQEFTKRFEKIDEDMITKKIEDM